MEKQEQVEWDELNKVLQRHGFKPVHFADPVENKNHSDLVFLDKRSAAEIRATLRTMLTDSERRQTLIHELVKSNNQLKEEVQEHKSQAVQQSQMATKLEGLLNRVKTRVQDLEDRYLSEAVQQHTRQLQQEKQEAQKLCEALEQKLLKQTEEKTQLQRKLYFTVKEEERRLTLQSQTFQNSCKNVSRHSSVADQQPTLKELKFYKHKLCRLEEINKPSITRLPKEYRTPQLSENMSDQDAECAHYYQLLTEISAIVTSPNAPSLLHRQKPSSQSVSVELACFQSLIPTLNIWAQQLYLLKELQQGLTKLAIRLMPWQPPCCGHNSAEIGKVEDMMLLVDSMLENSTTNDEKMLRSPGRCTLGSMVSHFQKLFDVTSLSGVYPRMNEVYTKLGEMTNAMRNLCDVLDLDDCGSTGKNPSTAEVVNQVATLVSSTKYSAGFHNVLGHADIDSIILKVKQHDEFFPAFHALITEISQTLRVSRLDDILPALKSLNKETE